MVKLTIWDTVGQEKYKAITTNFYRQANGIMLVYDVTSRDSFDHIMGWLQEAEKHLPEDACKLLVGNKAESESRVIEASKGLVIVTVINECSRIISSLRQEYAASLGIPFIETSAMTSTNVEEAFRLIAKEMFRSLIGS
jgi:Ras-related protein Rab-1A